VAEGRISGAAADSEVSGGSGTRHCSIKMRRRTTPRNESRHFSLKYKVPGAGLAREFYTLGKCITSRLNRTYFRRRIRLASFLYTAGGICGHHAGAGLGGARERRAIRGASTGTDGVDSELCDFAAMRYAPFYPTENTRARANMDSGGVAQWMEGNERRKRCRLVQVVRRRRRLRLSRSWKVRECVLPGPMATVCVCVGAAMLIHCAKQGMGDIESDSGSPGRGTADGAFLREVAS